MLIAIIIIGATFIVISFILNVENAKYLLAGYNTMPDEEKESVDIAGLVSAIKKLLLIMGISIIAGYVVLSFLSLDEYGVILIVIVPFIFFPLFLNTSKAYKKDLFFDGKSKYTVLSMLGFAVIGIPLLVVFYAFYFGLGETNVNIVDDKLVIDGFYGKEISLKEIKTAELVDGLPVIISRTGGSAIGQNLKGSFMTKEGRVYLNVKSRERLFLKIITAWETLYLSGTQPDIKQVYDTLAKKKIVDTEM